MTEAATPVGSGARRTPKATPGVPIVGEAVTIVPAGDARLLTGTLLWWEEDVPAGLVRASVDIAPTSAHGGPIKVWATMHAAGGDIVVLSGDASAGDTAHTLLLEARVAAREPRRSRVRAVAQVPVELQWEGGAEERVNGRTLDLSAGGCRLSIEGPAPALDKGAAANVVIHLDRHNKPRVSGRVHALRPGGQVVIRFDEVPDPVIEQIERYVYATLP